MAAYTYTVGETARETATFKVANVLTDPTTVTATVVAPDGTSSNPTVVRDSTGTYHVDIDLTLPGTWFVRIAGTGTAKGARETYITVRRSEVPGSNLEAQALVTVADMQFFLDRVGATADMDEVRWLEDLINEASSAIADYCQRQFTPERTAAAGRVALLSDPLATGVTKTFVYEGNSYLSFSPYEARTVTTVVLGCDLPTASQWTLNNGSTTVESEYRLEPRGRSTLGTYLRASVPTTRALWAGPTLPPPYPQGYYFGSAAVTGDWGAAAGAVPAAVKRACKITVGDWFRNPEEYARRSGGGVDIEEPSAPEGSLPIGARALLGPYRRT